MSNLLRQIRKLVTLSPRQMGLLASGTAYLAAARWTVLRGQARDIIGELKAKSGRAYEIPPAIDPSDVSWAIRTAAAGVPWRSDCLVQSLAASRWLRRNGMAAEFRLGVRSSGLGQIQAHAWIEHDGVVLTGGDDVTGFELLIEE